MNGQYPRHVWLVLVMMIVLVPSASFAQVCEPLDNGRLADVYHEGTLLYFEPVVEFRQMTLTISGPCEDVVKTFGPKDEITFDIREIERVTDGQYTWTLSREASIDEGVQQDLRQARFSGDADRIWWSFFQAGKIPAGPYTDSGSFTVERGAIVDPASGEEKVATIEKSGSRASGLAGTALAGGVAGEESGGGGNTLATKATVLTNADGVIRNSLCVGFDCPNNPTFSDSTILLTENNTRIKFDDTSTSASFPRNDWEIQANSPTNGGLSYLGINDCGQSSGGGCADDLVFAIEAGAPSAALYVDNSGRVGMGTSNPVTEIHTVNGDTPTLRLAQDGSSGFAPQTWDIAGNETSFFIRDATNGSTLPFRIRPGASSNSLVIDTDSQVGVGTLSPDSALHVRRTDGTATLKVEEAAAAEAARELATFQNNGTVTYRFTDTQGTGGTGDDFNWIAGLRTNNQFIITLLGTIGSPLWSMDASGNVTATSFNPTSSRELKEGFATVEPSTVLDKVLRLPITEWSYREDVTEARHLGPVAEDFRAAFGLGADDRHISVTDLGGVSLAAIQGLEQREEERHRETVETLRSKDEEIEDLKDRIADLERLVRELASER